MNISNYPKPQSLIRQDYVCGITWRGYLARATILAIGFGGYVLLTKNIDLSGNGKRCFYALRKYFPRGKKSFATAEYNDEACPVCLGGSKTDVRDSTGHFFCTKCLSRQTTSLLLVGPELEDSITVNECTNAIPQNVDQGASGDSESDPKSSTPHLLATNFWDNKRFNYLGRNLIAWSVLSAVALVAIQFQVVPWCEFIRYGSIFDFLIPLVVMPAIYIWFIYRESRYMLADDHKTRI